MTKKTLIKCGWLVSMDPATGESENTDILIEDDIISAIGPQLEAPADEVIDAGDMIVMPGLVEAHIHTWQTGLRGVGAEWVSVDYHKNMHGNMATRFNAHDVYLGNLFGALAQIDMGVTTILDWSHSLRDLEMAESAIDGLEEAKIRAVFAHGTAKPPSTPEGVPFGRIPHPRERVEALRKNRLTSDDQLVTLAMAILGPEFSSWDVTLKDFTLARDLGLLSSAHVWHGYNRSMPEEEVKDGYAKLSKLGLLGPDHNVVHGNYVQDDQLKMMLDDGVSITSTVLVETHGHGAEPLLCKVRDRGLMPSIGIDTALIVSDDMFCEMRAALTFARYREHFNARESGNYPIAEIPVKTREALEWATIGGARALQLEDKIGSLAVGKKADLVMLGANGLNLFPVHDPLLSVVELANSANVSSVMINGEFQKRDGKLVYSEDKFRNLKTKFQESLTRIMKDSQFVPGAK